MSNAEKRVRKSIEVTMGLYGYDWSKEEQDKLVFWWLAGRKSFIDKELPTLLEKAKEKHECECEECEECDGTWCKPREREPLHSDFSGFITEVIAMAEKDET